MTQKNDAPRHSWTRLDGVDLLRGLAILLVLLNHVNMRLVIEHVPYTAAIPRPLVHAFVWNGQFGVQIFFAISGFLITSITLKRWGALPKIKLAIFICCGWRASGRCCSRCLPSHRAALYGSRRLSRFGQDRRAGAGAARCAYFHVNVWKRDEDICRGNWDVLWSLSVEEMFYLFFPFGCLVFRRGRFVCSFPHFCRAGTLWALTPSTRTLWREYSYLGGMDAIALGCSHRDYFVAG